MTVAILTDSSACIPPALASEHGIVIVPISVALGEETFDADALDRGELLERLEAGERATTAAPSPGRWLQALQDVDRSDGVVVVTLSSSMSSTHRSATLAAAEVEGDVRIVDTGSAAGGLGLVALAAAELRDHGVDAVAERAREVGDRVHLVAAVGSLEYLARSGRVPELVQKAGDAIGVRPLFEFRDGEARILRPSLREGAVRQRLLSQWERTRGEGEVLHVTALHADGRAEAEALLAEIRQEVDPATAFVSTFDAAMIVHTGPDLVGLAWWWEQG